MRIDTHHHFWNYSESEYGWIGPNALQLRRDFAPADLKPLIDQAGIDAVVSVQARQSLTETTWLLDYAAEHDWIAGVVGWVPLASDDVAEHLEQLTHAAKLKSVRHVVQDEPDDEFLLGDKFNRGVSLLKDYGLAYDVLIFARHLPAAIRFVDLHPEQPFVLDHIAKPTIATDRWDGEWAKNIRELAKRENVTCKFSGVATEVRDESWSIDTVRPYWDVTLEAFGAERLMFGSDWPVCLLKTEYARWVDTAQQLAAPLSEAERKHFWFETAKSAYRLFR